MIGIAPISECKVCMAISLKRIIDFFFKYIHIFTQNKPLARHLYIYEFASWLIAVVRYRSRWTPGTRKVSHKGIITDVLLYWTHFGVVFANYEKRIELHGRSPHSPFGVQYTLYPLSVNPAMISEGFLLLGLIGNRKLNESFSRKVRNINIMYMIDRTDRFTCYFL